MSEKLKIKKIEECEKENLEIQGTVRWLLGHELQNMVWKYDNT